MKINRKFVRLIDLYNNDLKSKELIDKVLKKEYTTQEEYDNMINHLVDSNLRLIDCTDIGCGFGNSIGDLINGLKELDEMELYDNKYTLDDVNSIEIIHSDNKSITIAMYNILEGIKDIVTILRIEDEQVYYNDSSKLGDLQTNGSKYNIY